MGTNVSTYEIRAALCRINDRPAFFAWLQEAGRQFNAHIICFNADMLAGKRHAETAVCYAVRAFAEGNAISNTLEMEALLYAAGSRQCNVGTSFGICSGDNRLWVCCSPASDELWKSLSTRLSFQVASDWDRIDGKKLDLLMDLFKISHEELDTLESPGHVVDLVLERVALLEVLR